MNGIDLFLSGICLLTALILSILIGIGVLDFFEVLKALCAIAIALAGVFFTVRVYKKNMK